MHNYSSRTSTCVLYINICINYFRIIAILFVSNDRYKSSTILIMDLEQSGRVIQRLRGHDEEIQGLCWCPILGEDLLSGNKANKWYILIIWIRCWKWPWKNSMLSLIDLNELRLTNSTNLWTKQVFIIHVIFRFLVIWVHIISN